MSGYTVLQGRCMKLVVKSVLVFVVLISFMGCSVAPLTVPSGGTTLGMGEHEIQGYLMPAAAASLTYGATENVDIGATIESQIGLTYALWGKHSLINKKTGLSAAYIGGVFKGANSKGFYFAPTFGYSTDKMEWFTTIRYNKVYWDGFDDIDSDSDDSLISIFSIDSEDFFYWQADLGVNIKTGKRSSLKLGVTCLQFDGEQSCLPVLGMGVGI